VCLLVEFKNDKREKFTREQCGINMSVDLQDDFTSAFNGTNGDTAKQQDESLANKTDEEIQQYEINAVNQYVSERLERIQFKQALKEKNVTCERPDETFIKRLDSSIKKITAFIRRLKNLTESQKECLSKDITQLNLTKYISEVAAAFTEAKLKMNDINCALYLCSQLHQMYNEFSQVLFELWQKILNVKKEEKVSNPSKLRVDLRFFAELITIGVLPEKDSLSLLGNQLTIMTLYDKEHGNITIISSFCKHCGEDFADLMPIKIVTLAQKHDIAIPRNYLYSADRQKAVKNLLKEYYRTLCQHLISEHKEVLNLEKQNRKTMQVTIQIPINKSQVPKQYHTRTYFALKRIPLVIFMHHNRFE
jgi:regulator of nonsense transcripts 2